MKKRPSLLFIGIVLTFLLLGCTSETPNLQNQADNSTPVTPSEVSRIGIEESKVAYDNGEAIFLDVRNQDSYATGHIPGALSIPLNELEARIEELDRNQWIITYCT